VQDCSIRITIVENLKRLQVGLLGCWFATPYAIQDEQSPLYETVVCQ